MVCFISSLIAIEQVGVISVTGDSPYLVDKLFQTACFRFGVDGNAGRRARFALATALHGGKIVLLVTFVFFDALCLATPSRICFLCTPWISASSLAGSSASFLFQPVSTVFEEHPFSCNLRMNYVLLIFAFS